MTAATGATARCAVLALFLWAFHIPVNAQSGCATRLLGGGFPYGTASVYVAISPDFPNPQAVYGAMNFWNESCSRDYTQSYPPFVGSPSASCSQPCISVIFQPGTASITDDNGLYSPASYNPASSTISIYGRYGDPNHLQDTPVENMSIIQQLIAHELGHALGLNENGCASGVMNMQWLGGYYDVHPDECAVAGDVNVTAAETTTSDPYCDAYCWTSCQGSSCPPIPDGWDNPGCPIVLDLDNNGFHLTGLDDPVAFDLVPGGDPEMVGWTSAESRDAFLVYDRNANGRIDSGAELFGNNTLLPNGVAAPNGYVALAELDRLGQGGNGDGQISSLDIAFGSLRLWVDANHNGVTDFNELLTLNDAGITAISISYIRQGRHDRHGNLFRFKSSATKVGPGGQPKAVPTYDVYFRIGP